GKGSKVKVRETKFTFSPCGIFLLVPSICWRGEEVFPELFASLSFPLLLLLGLRWWRFLVQR
ncbi:unnamed protein product, partial [Musa hybrid cultivar]